MTQKFDSKYGAIIEGLYYARMSDLCKDENGKVKETLEEMLKSPEIKIVDGNVTQFGYVH